MHKLYQSLNCCCMVHSRINLNVLFMIILWGNGYALENKYLSAYLCILGINVYVTYLCNILCIWYHPCATKCIDANRLVFVPLELFHTEHGTEHNSHYLNKRILYFWITLYFVFLLFELIYFLALINNWTIFLLVLLSQYVYVPFSIFWKAELEP